MPVSVNPVSRAPDDTAQVLGMALNVARDIYKVRMDDKQTAKAMELTAKKEQDALTDADRKESLAFAQNFEVVKPDARGAIDPHAAGLSLPRGLNIPQGMAIRPRTVSENETKAQLLAAENAKDRNAKVETAQMMADIKKDNKPQTEGEKASALFGKRMLTADSVLKQMENDPNVGVTNLSSGIANLLPDAVRSKEFQQYNNAKRNFLTAVLRKESGASISPTEFSEGAKIYFAQPGDSQEVLAQKQALREQVITDFQQAAGQAWVGGSAVAQKPKEQAQEGVAYAAPSNQASQPSMQPGTIFSRGGKRYRVNPDGATATEI